MSQENKSKVKAVYTIVDRKGTAADKGAKPMWIRIGTAFVNRDRSLNVRLDALPMNGTIHIRDTEAFEPPPPSIGEETPQ